MSSKNQRTIDLIIPGLLNLPVYELNPEELVESAPALHKLLRFSQSVPNDLVDVDDILIRTLGLQQSALPYAFAMNNAVGSQQLLFKPIHLKADINNAIVFPVEQDSDDINILINDLADFFKEDCDIQAMPDNTWLMTLINCTAVLEMPHYLSALGKKVTHYQEKAKSSLDWFKLFNEMQMFLYQHEINQRRQLDGLPLVNSFWCWGADAYQGERLSDTAWFSDDKQMQRLGELYAGNSSQVTDFAQSNFDSNVVIVDLSILKLLKGQDEQALLQAIKKLEKNYFETLVGLKKHRIMVHTGGTSNFSYQALSNLKFWKKPVSIAEIIHQNSLQQDPS